MASKSSTLCKSLREEQRKYRKKILHKLCSEISYTSKTSKIGKIPYGFVNKMVQQAKIQEPWITRNVLNFAYKKFSKDLTTIMADKETKEPTSSITITSKVPGGRPKGTTNLQKHHLKEVLFATKNEIASLYLKEKEKYQKNGKKIPDYWLQNKVAEVSAKRGLPKSESISLATIRSRKGKNVMQGGGPETLMASVEPHLVELICAMAEIRTCLTASEAIALANSLILGTETERRIIKWKKARNQYGDNSPVILGQKWWKLFKKRWAHRLVTKRGQKFAMDRSNSLTYANVKKMYNDVYNCMVECGVAIALDEPSHQFAGDLVTKYHLTHPEMCLVVDEVGSNISQRGDL